jgi:pseudaminic acid synthase
MKHFSISNYKISNKSKPFIIAEISSNHKGSLSSILKLIKEIKLAGADAVKIQTYNEDIMTLDSKKKNFKINKGIWKNYSLYKLYKEAKTPFSWHKYIFDYAKKIGIICFSTPFDEKSCDFLSKFRVPAYKIASYELVDIPLIKYISKKGKPIIISSGMASLNEIQEALMAIKKTKNNKVILLHCISNYPTDFKNYNLEMMNLLKKKFKVFVGLSDHSIGDYVATAASALGARVIEKHVKLAGDKISHDSKFSMNTGEFKIYCKRIKKTWECLGEADFKNRIDRNEIKHRRSIYIVKNIKKGERTTIENIKRIRPSYGLHPKFYEFVLGKKVKKNLLKGQPMKLNYLIKK